MLTDLLAFVLQTLVMLFVLSFLVEAVVQVIVGSWLWRDDASRAYLRVIVLQSVAAAFGVILALAFGIDLIGQVVAFFDVDPVYPQFAYIVGCVLTGLLFGRGSNWFHDLLSSVKTPESYSVVNLMPYSDILEEVEDMDGLADEQVGA